jgi:autotransporter strand-loop-strand O-heptosyltransferase
MLENEVSNVSLLDGKLILEDINNKLVDGEYEFHLEVGAVDTCDYVHPYGINLCNQLQLEVNTMHRLNLVGLYSGVSTPDKYVCIAPMGSLNAKMWLDYSDNENKWQDVIKHLRELGYDVWYISKEAPYKNLDGVIDLSSDKYTTEDRILQLLGCEFFIGLSSGLAWLANACGKHVFRINTWSYGWSEFQDNVTVIENNYGVCRGCVHDGNFRKDEFDDMNYCPRNNDFQCSKSIPSSMVIESINSYLGL